MRRTIAAIVLGGLVLGAGCSSTDGLVGGPLYLEACAGCHGADGAGGIGPAIGPGSNAALALDDMQLGNVIRVGPGAMPAFAGRLTDDQIESLVTHLRDLQAE